MIRFDSEKKSALEEYNGALKNQKIDSRVIPILNIINNHKNYYSTSSCSGRILLLALSSPGAKDESIILDKWHNKIKLEELKASISTWVDYKYLYFFAQSPIFHVIARNLKAAVKLRNLGDSAGFKYSSIRSIKLIKHVKTGKEFKSMENEDIDTEFSNTSEARITVELLSTERLNVPIGQNRQIYPDDEYLGLLVELANNSITEAHGKLEKLKVLLEKQL